MHAGAAPDAIEVFPFGQPVLPRQPSTEEPREVYLLGAYPSGLHVRWTPPAISGQDFRPIRALIADNEPVPFWAARTLRSASLGG